MQAIDSQGWPSLPEQVLQEIDDSFYDSLLSITRHCEKQAPQAQRDEEDTLLFSNHSANLIEEWLDDSEDEVWQ